MQIKFNHIFVKKYVSLNAGKSIVLSSLPVHYHVDSHRNRRYFFYSWAYALLFMSFYTKGKINRINTDMELQKPPSVWLQMILLLMLFSGVFWGFFYCFVLFWFIFCLLKLQLSWCLMIFNLNIQHVPLVIPATLWFMSLPGSFNESRNLTRRLSWWRFKNKHENRDHW